MPFSSDPKFSVEQGPFTVSLKLSGQALEIITLYIWNITRINLTVITLSKMARTKFRRLNGGTCFMYPSLHQDVVNAISSDITSAWFQERDVEGDSEKEYSTHVMGRFRCYNKACSTPGWSSKMVAILIRGYPVNGYNAVVFNQRCKACDRLGTPELDENSYVDRVAYRLKKWAGITMEPRYYATKEGLPHVSRLCEGCKKGVCRETG